MGWLQVHLTYLGRQVFDGHVGPDLAVPVFRDPFESGADQPPGDPYTIKSL